MGLQQFQTSYQDLDLFRKTIASWQNWRVSHGAGTAVFHIFSDGADEGDIVSARAAIEELLPDAVYVGASASGNLYGGRVTTEKLVVTCTILERPDSFARTCLFSVENRDAASFREALRSMRDELRGVKAIELVMTIDTLPIREVCSILQEEIPEDVAVWGGGAFGDNTFTAYVFEKGTDFNTHGVVMTLFGGENGYICDRMTVMNEIREFVNV